MTEPTPETLAELRRLLDTATPRPWIACEGEDEVVVVLDDESNHWPGRYTAIASGFEQGGDYGLSDALLITAAVNALPALMDAAARLAEVEAERDAALALVSEHRCDVQAEAAYGRVLRLRAERDALAAKVERVRALHVAYYPFRPGRAYCGACEGDEFVPYPCSTIRALDGTTDWSAL